jgi:hypothetical protein
MKFSPFSLVIFIGAALAFAPFAAAQKLPAQSLRFDQMPLDHVARILSARFATPVTIAGNFRAPISGDFSALDLKQALAEAARQAGLVLVPAGSGGSAGFCLAPPDRISFFDPGSAQAAAKRRAELLKKREDLLDQAALLEH